MRYLVPIAAVLLIVPLGCATDGSSSSSSSSSSSGGGSGGQGGGSGGQGGGSGGQGGTGGCGPDDGGPNEVLGPGSDPAGGVFTLVEALEGLPEGEGPLRAVITTEVGAITCTLEPEKVPNGVANFVGLARGRRPWLDPNTNDWVKRRYYDGLIFHRIIDDFMAQGGDPLGTGTGGPGYQFNDEITDLVHTAGTLAYANSGANTNGSQYYITEIATDWLDGSYTIFGYCEPMSTIEELTATPTGGNDKPLEDVHMISVDITRCPL